MSRIERCWLVTRYGLVPVAFENEADAQRQARVTDERVVGEYVPAEQLRGAVDTLERIARAGEGVPDWRAMVDAARNCLERMGYELPPRGGR